MKILIKLPMCLLIAIACSHSCNASEPEGASAPNKPADSQIEKQSRPNPQTLPGISSAEIELKRFEIKQRFGFKMQVFWGVLVVVSAISGYLLFRFHLWSNSAEKTMKDEQLIKALERLLPHLEKKEREQLVRIFIENSIDNTKGGATGQPQIGVQTPAGPQQPST